MKLKNKIKLLIACDGGAASGKTTASKMISKKYNLKLLSSGLLYRYISYKLLSKKNLLHKSNYIKKISKNITLKKLKNNKLYSQSVTKCSAEIAKSKKIRLLLRKFQKNFAKPFFLLTNQFLEKNAIVGALLPFFCFVGISQLKESCTSAFLGRTSHEVEVFPEVAKS